VVVSRVHVPERGLLLLLPDVCEQPKIELEPAAPLFGACPLREEAGRIGAQARERVDVRKATRRFLRWPQPERRGSRGPGGSRGARGWEAQAKPRFRALRSMSPTPPSPRSLTTPSRASSLPPLGSVGSRPVSSHFGSHTTAQPQLSLIVSCMCPRLNGLTPLPC